MTAGSDAPCDAVARIFIENPPPCIGVAVSGGGDSMALLVAAQAAFPGRIKAVTVDHALRPASADEARAVAAFCAGRGIAHSVLRWQGPEPTGNLMDQARRARILLISDWAKARGMGDVLLGHTADDNAESLVMNLARSAGLDGLSGMRPDWHEEGVHWHRPLLTCSRDSLRAYLTKAQVTWIEDPSNDNPRFTRVKARRAMAALAPLGITAETLAASLSNLAAARHALMRVTATAAQGVTEHAGGLSLAREVLASLDPEIVRRLLSAAIQWMAGDAYPPRGAQLGALQARLSAGADAQLGGVRFLHRRGVLHILREPRSVMGPVALGQIWDHRWRLQGPADPGCSIRALGADGLRLCPAPRAALREALVVSPAVWRGDSLVAAPLAGLAGPFQAELSQGLADFILSH